MAAAYSVAVAEAGISGDECSVAARLRSYSVAAEVDSKSVAGRSVPDGSISHGER